MFPVPTLYVSHRVPASIDILQKLQTHPDFSTLRVVYIHNVRMELGSFHAYDADDQPIVLPPGLTGIPSLLSVTSNMAKMVSGVSDILSHYGMAGPTDSTKLKKYQSSESELMPKAFTPMTQTQTPTPNPNPTPVYNPNLPGVQYTPSAPLPPPIHVPSENEKKAAINAARMEEYARHSK